MILFWKGTWSSSCDFHCMSFFFCLDFLCVLCVCGVVWWWCVCVCVRPRSFGSIQCLFICLPIVLAIAARTPLSPSLPSSYGLTKAITSLINGQRRLFFFFLFCARPRLVPFSQHPHTAFLLRCFTLYTIILPLCVWVRLSQLSPFRESFLRACVLSYILRVFLLFSPSFLGSLFATISRLSGIWIWSHLLNVGHESIHCRFSISSNQFRIVRLN